MAPVCSRSTPLDNTLRLFNIETGEAVAGFPAVARQFYLTRVVYQVIRESYSPEPNMKTFVLKISPDGRTAAVGGCEPEEDGNCYTRTVLRLIDIDTGATLFNLEALAPVIDLLAFSPDGSELAIAACDLPLYLVGEMDTICDGRRLWTVDTATGEMLHRFGEFHSRITSLVWSPDGTRLYSGVEFYKKFDFVDNEISVFDTATGERLGIVEPEVGNCSEQWIDVSPDGRYLLLDLAADCGYPSFVQWWDVTDASRPRSIHQEVPARYHRLSPDGTRVLTVNTIGQHRYGCSTSRRARRSPGSRPSPASSTSHGSCIWTRTACGWKSTDTRSSLICRTARSSRRPSRG